MLCMTMLIAGATLAGAVRGHTATGYRLCNRFTDTFSRPPFHQFQPFQPFQQRSAGQRWETGEGGAEEGSRKRLRGDCDTGVCMLMMSVLR